MKFLALALLALMAVTAAQNNSSTNAIDREDNTAYGYLSKIGAPAADRIREAEEQEETQYPYLARLIVNFSGGQAVCGGSLIRANRVLTAAHCCFDGINQASSFTVVLGSDRFFSGGTRVTTNNFVMHQNWNPGNSYHNDIAIIRLNSTVGLSNNIVPIRLPGNGQLNDNFADENATAFFIDSTADGGIITVQGQPVITNAACREYFPRIIQKSNICVSGAGGRSTCNALSGGPLTIIRNGRPVLIGVVSFESTSDCQVGYPVVHTRVTSFNNWINRRL